ncbi:hypothetical protein EIP91_004763 [Steccherinum ochraceum]|uniref:Uncharacterized protein n=1 Tax=Steccherinum ochraceum TaxID=92696 RepID=A0A4R0RAS2_9APHY|nr:hypothetical protein EIP91_004763 [Steccherinum ochraceum]
MTSAYRNFPVLHADLTGRTVLVVGSNTGIGFEAAKHLARMNPKRLIGTCRSEEKCKKAEEEIREETGSTAVVCWPLELTSFASIKAFVDRLEQEGDELDIALLNAAVQHPDYGVTEDGFERCVQTNHLGGALLSYLLLPILLKTAERTERLVRLTIVASSVHGLVSFGTDKFPKDQGIIARLSGTEHSTPENMGIERYCETKLLNVLFARALQSHLPASSPIVVSLADPGLCKSNLIRNIDRGQFDERMKNARTSEEGSRQLILAALSEKGGVDAWRGAFLSNNELTPPSAWVLSDEGKEAQERIWSETMDISSKADARVVESVKLFTD